MATARELIESAARLVGILATGESLQGGEAADGLVTLNDMIEAMNNERLLIFEISRDTHTLTASTNPHTIGSSGADITATRPQKILNAGLIESGENVEHPIKIISAHEYRDVPLKTTESDIPYVLWYEPEYPLGKIHLYPVPSAAQTLVLYTRVQLGSLATLTTTVSFPPGYQKMLRYNLACDLAPEYGRVPPDLVMREAKRLKMEIKNLNSSEEEMLLGCDSAIAPGRGEFDYRTGDYRR